MSTGFGPRQSLHTSASSLQLHDEKQGLAKSPKTPPGVAAPPSCAYAMQAKKPWEVALRDSQGKEKPRGWADARPRGGPQPHTPHTNNNNNPDRGGVGPNSFKSTNSFKSNEQLQINELLQINEQLQIKPRASNQRTASDHETASNQRKTSQRERKSERSLISLLEGCFLQSGKIFL